MMRKGRKLMRIEVRTLSWLTLVSKSTALSEDPLPLASAPLTRS